MRAAVKTYPTTKLFFCGLLLGVLALTPSTSHAQMGVYDEVGMGFSAGLFSADQAAQKSASLGLMVAPAFEFGSGFSRSSAGDQDASVVAAAPYIALYPVRPGEESSASMMFIGSYSFQSMTGNTWGQQELPDTYTLGTALFGALKETDHFRFIPYVGAGAVWVKASDQSNPYFSVRGSFVFETVEDVFLGVTPSATFAEGSSTLGISMAFVLGESHWQ